MERAGEVVRVAQGLAVLRADGAEPPTEGSEVLAEDLETVGRVVSVFGPVDRPYLAVSPAAAVRPARLLGSVLYARPEE